MPHVEIEAYLWHWPTDAQVLQKVAAIFKAFPYPRGILAYGIKSGIF